ncbi:MAG TPA: VOC family protein [Pyrinomonadaceae bacterium]|nr:VOC family protein [Pyrinomonadaceae bacterium]
MEANAYLLFDGDCAEAFKFYESVMDAKIEGMFPYAGSPAAEQAPPDFGEKIMHATLSIGNTKLMASDAPPGQYKKPEGISVALGLNDTAKGEQIFNALSENGHVIMPFQQTFWAAGFGMCVDRFGIPWMVNCEAPH